MNRRSVVKSLGLAFASVQLGASARAEGSQVSTVAGPYKLPALPYAYDALEPYIDAETMHLHHDKHHATYVEKLNAAIVDYPKLAKEPVDRLIANLNVLPEEVRGAVRNQGGGHANHSFWWPILSKQGGKSPKGELARDIDRSFGSFSQFHDQFAKAASGVFGSGWAWLTLAHDGALRVEATPNQDSPVSAGRTPVLGIDVWEHAYYLKYNNRRTEYITAFFGVVNWDVVSGEYAAKRSRM